MDPGVGKFRGFGHPRESPHYEVSVDPTLQRMLNADIEAKRLRTETEVHTPGGREKAAKEAEAELAEKRRAWGTRVCAEPLDGFIGIYDSAKDKELRVYTRTYDLQHKFWGVKPVGMAIWDFWDIYDPEVKRYHDANQETPASLEPSTSVPPPEVPATRTKVAMKPERRQKTPDINPTHRVRKSTAESPKVNKKTRKPLAHNVGSGHPNLDDQMRQMTGTDSVSGRSARNKKGTTASGAQQAATKDGDSVLSKRPRGRPPIKEKLAKRSPKQKKTPAVKGKLVEKLPRQKRTPAVKGNSRVTKSSQTKRRPSAPSTHKMRTRGEGPAELLQLP